MKIDIFDKMEKNVILCDLEMSALGATLMTVFQARIWLALLKAKVLGT